MEFKILNFISVLSCLMSETTVSAHSVEQYLLDCCNDSSQETDESNIRYGRESEIFWVLKF
ncbi:hypothetical protein T11_17945 [Trichinella zimbabwensis]|uniref:Uncharacterized protein n=1 Tax=Trichinella zimbabwensis TaxID=268475 RepID=A0A0V1GUQ6_9BILA|nr:hypothetical protein T11_14920 [Trichinella zimbabwensis]KRZ01699.1 hypothetical protein T11_17945 [Trichinella zimbabwensis]